MFSSEEMQIFEYEVCGETRRADPLVIRRALLRASGGQFYNWLEGSREPEEFFRDNPQDSPEQKGLLASSMMAALDYQERVLACVREAFNLAPFDAATGTGVMEIDCWDVISQYTRWTEKKRSQPENSLTT